VSTNIPNVAKKEKSLRQTIEEIVATTTTAGAGLVDGDYGDVLVGGTGTTMTVETAAGIIFLQNTATTAQIQAALDSLTSGGVVVLAAGSYTLSATLYMSHSGLTLRGSGESATYLYQLDRNKDCIVMECSYCTVEDLFISGTNPALVNGGGAAGTGRGIVMAQPLSTSTFANPTYAAVAGPGGQITFPTIRRVTVTNTASWCIYDSGLKTFTTAGDNWTSPLTTTTFCLSVLLTLDHVNVSYWASNGGLFIGSGAAAPRVKALKTNGYSFNTFTQISGAGAAPKNDMGGVFLYNVYGATFDDGCYLQSPVDGGVLPDKDATLISFLNCISIKVDAMKFECLSGTTADSNNGAGGRQYYFITACNSHYLKFRDCHFQSYMPDGGSTLSNFGLKIIRTAAPPSTVGAMFDGGYATHERTTLGAASGARDAGEPTTWDRNDFVFAGDGDGNITPGSGGSECGVIDFVVSNNTTGKFREPTTPIDAFTVLNCSTGGVPTTALTTTASFVNVNRGDLVSGAGVTAGTIVQYVTGLTTIVLDQNATVVVGTTLTFTPWGNNTIRRPGFHWRERRGPVRMGQFASCDLTGAGDSADFYARWALSHASYDGVLAYVRTADLDEGLWLGNACDGQVRQIPMYRRRSSFWTNPKQGDLNYLTSDESLYTYNSTAAAFQSYVKRSIGTAAGDLIKYTASDTPARLGIGSAGQVLTVVAGAPAWTAMGTGATNVGQATVAFASYLTEDSIAVTGQAAILAGSTINVSVYADNDDVLAQDWQAPVVRSVVAGTGFTITLRPKGGTFKGNVKMNWQWA
jgi:hypothetical protein